ncbi:uncharacterized protein TRIADDRAFT_21100 [Trichoplax adhaerens]|uniref:Lysophospholipid acyltransferase 7 n=1 Tax=Trichoplax adhaerens TaxID=10228 RepID=B3RN13_TRIAD|nr:hypothetical protein TRIADDRAFT_21100 [Trichoplax adhaerens]EDV27938.1 hypothetical protein TRIADDRAFT_21100 [Trichoplax adhaerens]|eukprot:XP_002109772.1 hypothetical protein TRIADDRAFT_21100 [Trichoplax adhaerens]
MSPDDIIYVSLLLVSIPIGFLIKNVQSAVHRQWLTFAIGLSIAIATIGFDVVHSFVTILGTYIICRFAPYRYCHTLGFLYSFLYLLFFRIAHYFGLPKPCNHSNAIQLILTIKMASIAFDVHFWHLRKTESVVVNKLPGLPIKSLPSLFDFLSYGYCYCGLLSGPYFQYRVYKDMIDNPNAGQIEVLWPAMKRLRWVPILVGISLSLGNYRSAYIISEEFYNSTIFDKLFYVLVHFIAFRFRFYIGWALAESACVIATLGAYPEATKPRPGAGPTIALDDNTSKNDQYNFETVYNLDIYQIETGTTLRPAMRYWNMTVQWWLSAFIYRYWLVLLFIVSAFWHGIRAGYYFSFMTTLLCTLGQDRFLSFFSPYFRGSFSSKAFHFVANFVAIRLYEYSSLGFIFLDIDNTVTVSGSLYYWGHIFSIIMITLSLIKPSSKGVREKMSKVD